MVLSVEANGLGEEVDVFNVVMVSTTPGLIGEDASFSVLDMCAVGVEAVVLDSDTSEEVSDIETAWTTQGGNALRRMLMILQ